MVTLDTDAKRVTIEYDDDTRVSWSREWPDLAVVSRGLRRKIVNVENIDEARRELTDAL